MVDYKSVLDQYQVAPTRNRQERNFEPTELGALIIHNTAYDKIRQTFPRM